MKEIIINSNEEARIVIKNPDGKEVHINICMIDVDNAHYSRDIYINRQHESEYSQDICCVAVSEKDTFDVLVAADENSENYTDEFTIKPTPDED